MGSFDFLCDAFEENAKSTTKRLSQKSGDPSIYEDWTSGREKRDELRGIIKDLFSSSDDDDE